MVRCGLTIASALLLAGCQRSERASQPASAPTPAAPAAPIAQPPKPGDRFDVHGLTVQFLEGGFVELRGRDRWGQPLDTTYESVDFFRKALPVLERSVSAEQAKGLRALLDAR
jgi:hypothetical protein